MDNMTAFLWAFAATILNDHVLAAPSKPLAFLRGNEEYRLVHADYDRPGWATCQLPGGERSTTNLTDDEVGKLLTSYCEATGRRIELPEGAGRVEGAGRAAAAGYK